MPGEGGTSASGSGGWKAALWGWCNLSTLSCLAMGYYVYMTMTSLSILMHPFEGVEVLPGAPTVKPLWPEGTPVSVLAYLSTSKTPSHTKAFNGTDPNLPMLWELGNARDQVWYSEQSKPQDRRVELIAPDAKGKAALATAEARLATKKARIEEAGGSVLMMAANYLFEEDHSGEEAAAAAKGELLNVRGKKLWEKARQGQQVYLHVVVARGACEGGAAKCGMATRAHDQFGSLHGAVELVKFDKAVVERQKRWLLQDFGLGAFSGVTPYPDEETLQARKSLAARNEVTLKAQAKGKEPPPVPKWKPEVAVRLVVDPASYPVSLGAPHANVVSDQVYSAASGALQALHERVVRQPTNGGDGRFGGLFHKPVLHVDEIGLTSDKYLPLNDTVGSLPLKLTFSPMAPGRLRLMSHFAQSLESQKELGFSDSDIDDVRRLVSDTSVYLLAVTLLASVLHLLFEFLAFKSDVQFWRKNKSLRGLSVRTLFVDLFSQLIILLFLMDTETSLLVTVPSAMGVAIQLWKCQRATGMVVQFDGWRPKIVASRFEEEGGENGDANSTVAKTKKTDGDATTANNKKDNDEVSAAAVVATTTPTKKDSKKDSKSGGDPSSTKSSSANKKAMSVAEEAQAAQAQMEAKEAAEVAAKTAETMRIDRMAVNHMTVLLLPLVVGFSLRSLVFEEHYSWYSWAIAALTGTVYTFGFVLMTPQLFINHHLKSVSHLPWRFLCFRFVNTFIDDLFAFIIRMPTMHRISCFRDDVVFFVYLYQRWAYPVDKSRGVALEDMTS